ncbi:MAG: hypothetical protein INR69_08405 [Mucilaginibacter polytrichastri]|nr:hypothetical protein [Mucilaginibacter polytrichastri]
MNELIKRITEKTGISEEQASQAIQTVVTFLKSKLPGGLGEHLDQFIAPGDPKNEGEKGNSLGDPFGGLFK